MKTYDVDVEGKTYEVDAPDPGTAWQYANAHHRAEQVKLEEAGKAKGGEYKIGEAGFRDAAKQVANETGAIGRGLQGVGETFDRYAYGAEGLVSDLSPEKKQRLAQNKIMTEEGGPAAAVGQAVGDLAISAPLMVAGAGAAPAIGRALPMATGLVGRTVGAVAPSAALGALSEPENRATGAAFGAAGGAAGAGINRVVGGVLKPFVSTEGKELIAQGIQPTPGQAVGGALGTLEEKAGSLPVIGDLIGGARNRAITEYNQALAGRTAQEITREGGLPRAAGRKLGKAGDESLLALRQKIGDVYEDVLSRVPQLRIEPELIVKKLNEVANDPALGLSDANAKRLLDYVNKHVIGRGADISGQVAKQIESDMGKVATSMKSGASTAEERAFGEALDRFHTFWREGLTSAVPPEYQQVLKNANAAWRGMVPLDTAAATAGSQLRGQGKQPGVFTPRVLRSALAKGDKSQNDNVLRTLQAKGVGEAGNPYEYNAAMARAGQTLGDVVPDSGTAGRLMAGAGILGGAAVDVGTTLGTGAMLTAGTAAAYSRTGAMLITQGAFPATREATAAWLAKQGVPREAIPMLVEQTLQTAARTAGARRPQRQPMLPQSLQQQR